MLTNPHDQNDILSTISKSKGRKKYNRSLIDALCSFVSRIPANLFHTLQKKFTVGKWKFRRTPLNMYTTLRWKDSLIHLPEKTALGEFGLDRTVSRKYWYRQDENLEKSQNFPIPQNQSSTILYDQWMSMLEPCRYCCKTASIPCAINPISIYFSTIQFENCGIPV